MAVPTNFVQAQGQASVTSDQINTFVQTVTNVVAARNFIGIGQMEMLLQGFVSPGDGGQGTFGWSATSSAPDDGGVNVIAPSAAGPEGRWIRIPPSSGGGGQLTIARAPVYVIDGGGSPITTGIHGTLYLPFALTLNSVALTADQTGSVVIDIGAVSLGAYNGSFTGSITASDMPTLSSTISYFDAALTGWTTALAAGTVLIFTVVSVSTIERLTITLGALG